MKVTEIYLILCQWDAGKITLKEAHELILGLFDASNSICPQCGKRKVLKEYTCSECYLKRLKQTDAEGILDIELEN